ncbi:homocysteine S-methyltransferase family protein [Cardiobacterium valvarum]|uniref:homocysteine S-methyltransferase family protein n=1 Tax=Cardiobacterium valvarum TaxID=194702 RepID=UPI0028FCF1CC|nr:homocysteine S-methyltransferase family protein [Cardiobacterium valvarum]
MAQQAVGDSGKKLRVTASLPPPFGACRADLFDAAQAPAIARPLVDGQAPYADLWLAGTQSSTAEVRTLHALAPHDRPFWATFTLDDEHPAKPPRLHSGESIADAVATVIDLGADALLFNCSHPEIMADAIVVACAALDAAGSTLRLGVYANAFCAHDAGEAALPANNGLDDIRTDLSPAAYLALAQTWRDSETLPK